MNNHFYFFAQIHIHPAAAHVPENPWEQLHRDPAGWEQDGEVCEQLQELAQARARRPRRVWGAAASPFAEERSCAARGCGVALDYYDRINRSTSGT